MFIYAIWDEICLEISKSKKSIRIDQIVEQSGNAKWIAIKHDVETNVEKAEQLAKIEYKYGIQATYYVQADLLQGNIEKLKKIQNMGHEVTYHYDVLDANNGNFDVASDEFAKIIKAFAFYGFEVRTVCPHGNPIVIRDGWSSNKDFFRDKSIVEKFPNILDMVVQLPNILSDTYAYISDTGYGWRQIVNIKDNDIVNHGDIDLGDYKNLLKIIDNEDRVILSTHPHRWEGSKYKFLFNVYFFKMLRFVAKKAASIPFFKKIMSKYYYLAKKV